MSEKEILPVEKPEDVSTARDYEQELLEVLNGDYSSEEITDFLSGYHDNDIAAVWGLITKENRFKLYGILGDEKISEIFSYIEDDVEKFIEELDASKVADIIENMDVDDAVDILEELTPKKKEEIIDLLDEEAKEDILLVSSYEEDQIGSIITTNFIVVNKNLSPRRAMKELVLQAADNDNITTIYAVNDDMTYYGAIRLKDLFTAKPEKPLDDVISVSYPFFYATENTEECIDKLKDYGEDSVPVLDDKNNVIGVVTSADVVEIVDEILTEDYVKFAAVSQEEDSDEKLWVSLKKRTPWLLSLMALGILISAVTGLFEGVIDALPFLVFSQALVLGMSGNVGTQSLAVTIRVLTDENLTGKDKFLFTLKELRVAFVNGIILSLTAFAVMTAYYCFIKTPTMPFNLALKTASCVSLSMFIAMIFSGIIGSTSPIILHKCKVDPAVASGPLITALNDLISVVVYYGLALILLT